MKHCPTCGTQYTDDTLRFCLQDGAALTDHREAETPTVVRDETPTIARTRRASESETRAEARYTDREGRPAFYLALFAAGATTLLLVGGAVATLIYLSSGKRIDGNNAANGTNNVSRPSPGNVSGFFPTPSPRITVTPTENFSPSPTPTPTPLSADREAAEREVSQSIYRWKTNAESINLNAYMESYAGSVDYYNRQNASRAYVRSDKARAFGMYRSIRIQLSNMNVSVDVSGSRATAQFDKEWDFRGPRNSSGKVRSQLKFQLENGRWLITGEKDLRVYYVN